MGGLRGNSTKRVHKKKREDKNEKDHLTIKSIVACEVRVERHTLRGTRDVLVCIHGGVEFLVRSNLSEWVKKIRNFGQ